MFKLQFTLEQRLQKIEEIKKKYPLKLPLIVEARKGSTLKLDHVKYLVEPDMTIGHFIYVLARRLKLKPEECLFLFVNNKIFPTDTEMREVFKTEKENDGFVYCIVSLEDTFGF